MAEAELHRPGHARTRPDDSRTLALTNCYDHRLPTTMGPNRVVKEELVG